MKVIHLANKQLVLNKAGIKTDLQMLESLRVIRFYDTNFAFVPVHISVTSMDYLTTKYTYSDRN